MKKTIIKILISTLFLIPACANKKADMIRIADPAEFGYSKISQTKTTVYGDDIGFHVIHDRTSSVEYQADPEGNVTIKVDGKKEGIVSKICDAATSVATAKMIGDD